MSEADAPTSTPGRRLRHFVDTVYVTVKAFAEAVGMQPSNLHKYLNDEREACISVLARFAEAGCDIHWIVSGEGDMFADNDRGHQLRVRFGNDPGSSSLASSAFLNTEQQKISDDLERLKGELWQVTAERREELLMEQNRLLEKWGRLLERENYLQKGRIEVLERVLGGARGG